MFRVSSYLFLQKPMKSATSINILTFVKMLLEMQNCLKCEEKNKQTKKKQ